MHFRLVAAFGLLVAAAASALAQTGPIVVHHIGPLTGVLAASNEEALGGARLFLDGLNARGGVGGRQVTMQSIDDAQDAAKSKALLDKLIADRQLLALMMPRTTPSMEAMLPAVGANGIPVVGPQTGAAFVNNPVRREVFTLRASYQKEAEVALRQQVSIGVRRIGLLLADDAFGKDVMLAVDRVMVELQVKPLASAKIDNRKAEVSEAVDTILAARPEVVLLVVSGKSAAAFIKEYRKKGGNATFISLSNTSNADYVTALGDQARGAIVMQIMPSPYSAATALAREYAAAAAAKKVPPSYAGLYGYASAKLLALGLAKAGREPTPASLVQALEGLGEVDLGGFRVKYGPGQRVGSTFVDSTIINSQGRFMR